LPGAARAAEQADEDQNGKEAMLVKQGA
jgi:hypothetical protein